ncbi:MAG: UvrD-helicase domain-containing protein [Schleiferiaceae bacterium]|nr:UvrD-helicase domain-containing protein [Schleiferiaceae bacterium]
MASTNSESARIAVYSASAGAGKTFRLAVEYGAAALARPDDPGAFRRILGLTFTNKAAHEMKDRVLRTLQKAVELDDPFADPIAKEIALLLDIDAAELRRRAAAVLSEMLHDYGAVSLGTLDQFTHRLVRTFAIELGLPSQFEVELDDDYLLDLAVYELMSDLGTDSALTQLVLDFARANLEDDKQADVFEALKAMAKHLSKEASTDAVAALRGWDLDRHRQLQTNLRQKATDLRARMRAAAPKLLKLLASLPAESVNRADWYASYFKKLRKPDAKLWVPGAHVRKSLMGDPVAILKVAAQKDSALRDQAEEVVAQMKTLLGDPLETALDGVVLDLLRRHDRSASVLSELARRLEDVLDRLRVQPIWKFQPLIHRELRDQPTSYLYERLGERYARFLVDEAQDTSRMQWANLWPLMEHALTGREQGAGAMVVGDGKQSIYRWRGSDAEEFLDLVARAKKGDSPSDALPGLEGMSGFVAMGDNWRSRHGIVAFNNRLYTGLAAKLGQDDHRTAYADSAQNPRGASGGYVQLRGIEAEDKSEFDPAVLDALVADVRSRRAAGWSWGDMAVIMRRRAEGRMVAERFAAEGIPILSSELLAVTGSAAVQAMVALFRWMLRPGEPEREWDVLRGLRRAGVWQVGTEEWLLLGQSRRRVQDAPIPEDFEPVLRRIIPGWSPDVAWRLSLYEMGAYTARALGFNDDADAFVLRLLDAMLDFSKRQVNRLEAFMEEYARRAPMWSVSAPAGADAVELLTVHKAKGLEYPIVFFPWAQLDNPRFDPVWLDPRGVLGPDLDLPPSALVPLTKFSSNEGLLDEVGQRWPAYAERVRETAERAAFDDANLLYVATTRAVDELWVYFDPKKGYGGWWLQHAEAELAQGEARQLGENLWAWGAMPAPEAAAPAAPTWDQSTVRNRDWTDTVKLARPRDEEPEQRFGNALHAALERIRDRRDAAAAAYSAAERSQLDSAERDRLVDTLALALDAPELADWWTATETYTERSLLHEGGVLRPDRIYRRADGRWVVADYKTGAPQAEHEEQVRRYADLLEPVLGERPLPVVLYLRRPTILRHEFS